MTAAHRILAVDDNPRNLAIVERSLNGEFQLVTATSGEEALEIAPRFRPDVVLLDIMMPGLDGYETCRRLRALPALASCKIVMVSARATTADRLEGYAAGANDYVTKPFDGDELLAKLRVYVRLKSVEELDRLKSDTLSLLSHETRTPLTAILSPAAMLLEDPTLSGEQRELAQMVRDGGMRLLSLIEKVTYLSQLKAGAVPRELTSMAPEDLATRAVASARMRSKRADVRVDLSTDASGVLLQVDVPQVQHALESILDNALRLSPPSATVRVRACRSGPWSSIEVTDQGPGIRPEFLDRVFHEFAVEDVRHHDTGHGLSLATALVIVEQHGGELSVASEPGRGATFTMLLPTADALAEAA